MYTVKAPRAQLSCNISICDKSMLGHEYSNSNDKYQHIYVYHSDKYQHIYVYHSDKYQQLYGYHNEKYQHIYGNHKHNSLVTHDEKQFCFCFAC